MSENRVGVEIRDPDGNITLQVGAHVIQQFPDVAQKLGEIATFWAQIEVNLISLCSVLAEENLYKTKKGKFHQAQHLLNLLEKEEIRASLDAPLSSDLMAVLRQVEALKDDRNLFQHCVWGVRITPEKQLFALTAEEYHDFLKHFLDPTKDVEVQPLIDLSQSFAESEKKLIGSDDFLRVRNDLAITLEQVSSVLFKVILALRTDE